VSEQGKAEELPLMSRGKMWSTTSPRRTYLERERKITTMAKFASTFVEMMFLNVYSQEWVRVGGGVGGSL